MLSDDDIGRGEIASRAEGSVAAVPRNWRYVPDEKSGFPVLIMVEWACVMLAFRIRLLVVPLAEFLSVIQRGVDSKPACRAKFIQWCLGLILARSCALEGPSKHIDDA